LRTLQIVTARLGGADISDFSVFTIKRVTFEVRLPRCVFKLQYQVDNFKTQLFYLLANVGKVTSN